MTTTKRTNLFIDEDLWRGLRVRAIEEGTTATAIINKLIAGYLDTPARTPKKRKRAR
jgi:hypothetical protein